MNRNESNIRLLLKDLGKATQRGVRKCPKCLTLNGTRGIKCKNKECSHLFKVINNDNNYDLKVLKSNDKKVIVNGLECIRCVTANNCSNIYSVRVRDRGPDYRGFVEVPIITGLDGTSDPSLNPSFIAETTARCFVEVCGDHKMVLPIDSNQTHFTQSHKNSSNITLSVIESCLHIKHAVKCGTDAKPLIINNSVLNMLQMSSELREKVYHLANDSPGPLVQRVSKNSMVVKCKPNNKQPLGYLHCSFTQLIPNSNTHKSNTCSLRFWCSCKAFKSFKCSNSEQNTTYNKDNNDSNTDNVEIIDKTIDQLSDQRKCVHYYVCIAAIASDTSLTIEFSYYINKELPQFVSIKESINSQQNNTFEKVDDKDEDKNFKIVKKDNRNEAINTRKLIDRGIISEFDISITFVDWLSSVTELINQTMHYQLNGHPEPLVFKIPQGYFDCLQQRIATGLRKKRLPNITTVFTRKDSPPLGTFTKYTYFITNIIHVKQIFDTSHLPLEITQSFVQNRDGSYDYLNSKCGNGISNGLTPIDCSPILSATNNLLIKPSELKTYLKVGLMSPDQKEAIPFIIEWIPDILPKCHFGELRIQLQYGHLKNGRIDKNE